MKKVKGFEIHRGEKRDFSGQEKEDVDVFTLIYSVHCKNKTKKLKSPNKISNLVFIAVLLREHFQPL